VLAFGGNALLKRGGSQTIEAQRENARVAAEAVGRVARTHDVVLTHGNGPQVGILARLYGGSSPANHVPLDMLGAETEGMIGYLLEREIANEIQGREVATLLTQVEVDPADSAFESPTKPIGRVYTEEEAKALVADYGWTVAADGKHWRRVVASPFPHRILESRAIERLVDAGVLLICAGGGGIPVFRDAEGKLRGADAVIDKDLTAELLARTVNASALLLLTDVSAVEVGWGTPEARQLNEVTVSELQEMEFDVGSMGPKIRAACTFVERTGRMAAIGSLGEADLILAGEAGTRVLGG
jgi:carbamate kinase